MRAWTGTIVLAGLALGLSWLESAGPAARGVRSAERACTAEEPRCGAEIELVLPAAGTECGRVPDPSWATHAEELAHAHWVEGRVIFPAGTPADERCVVVATGRTFADGSIGRAGVGSDGRFRVPFSPGAKAGWIGIEARMLLLPVRARWLVASEAKEVVLAPELGGIVTGRLRLPAGARARLPGGEVELHSSWRRVAPLRGGEFVFEQVPAEPGLWLEYRGSSWLARSSSFAPVPGETKRVDLALVLGVVLGGRVRDEQGRPIEDASVLALGTTIRVLSGRDGSFRLPALEAGTHTLIVSRDSYLPAKRELGSLAAGRQRTDLAFRLARGESIAGRVLDPGGAPAAASVRVMPNDDRSSDRTSGYARCEKDGSFLIQGLLPGSYRLEAWSMHRSGKIEATPRIVESGTTDLEIRL